MTKITSAIHLVGSFLYTLVQANLTVALIVLSPRLRIRPAIVAYRTDLRSSAAITALANMITLTPGTLTIEISSDQRTLYVHALDMNDKERLLESIRYSFERHLLELEK